MYNAQQMSAEILKLRSQLHHAAKMVNVLENMQDEWLRSYQATAEVAKEALTMVAAAKDLSEADKQRAKVLVAKTVSAADSAKDALTTAWAEMRKLRSEAANDVQAAS